MLIPVSVLKNECRPAHTLPARTIEVAKGRVIQISPILHTSWAGDSPFPRLGAPMVRATRAAPVASLAACQHFIVFHHIQYQEFLTSRPSKSVTLYMVCRQRLPLSTNWNAHLDLWRRIRCCYPRYRN
ncbi:hypothetical protein X992_5480 [Burkholderia pseudomallei MSHR5492]|nr:hypothetical protein X992_5480 [Burkholderia pseudomallei MSHR5492]